MPLKFPNSVREFPTLLWWPARCRRVATPRRLHTSRIDVKLRQGVAETMERRSMRSECKTTALYQVELVTSSLLNL